MAAMTPERVRQIEELYHAVREGTLEDRADNVGGEIVGAERRKSAGVPAERRSHVAEDHRIARVPAHRPSIFAGRFSLNALTPSA